jgi:hypothetical protein
LAQLLDEIIAGETLLAVPPDLAGDEDLRATGDDRVGIAFRPQPGGLTARNSLIGILLPSSLALPLC